MENFDYSKCKKKEKEVNLICLKQSIDSLTICTIDGKKCEAIKTK